MSEPVRTDAVAPTTATSQRASGPDLVSLAISGREIRIRSDEPKAHLEALARYVDDRLAQIAGPKKIDCADPNLLLITALQLADEVFKLKNQQQELAQRLRSSSRSLLGRLSADPARAQTAAGHEPIRREANADTANA
jgi:cell division protein ZapA (FtsZ GTPase activity inhibitor)